MLTAAINHPEPLVSPNCRFVQTTIRRRLIGRHGQFVPDSRHCEKSGSNAAYPLGA